MAKKTKEGTDLASVLQTKLGDLFNEYDVEEILEAVERFKNLIPVGEQIWKAYKKDVGQVVGLLLGIALDVADELQPILARGHALDAKRRISYFSALVKEGFAREEAMQILLAGIKPLDFSGLNKSVQQIKK